MTDRVFLALQVGRPIRDERKAKALSQVAEKIASAGIDGLGVEARPSPNGDEFAGCSTSSRRRIIECRRAKSRQEGADRVQLMMSADEAGAQAVARSICTRARNSGHGAPLPNAAARQLGVAPATCAAGVDSTNGLLSARAAAMSVIAVPDPRYPPTQEALAAADVHLGSLRERDTATLEGSA